MHRNSHFIHQADRKPSAALLETSSTCGDFTVLYRDHVMVSATGRLMSLPLLASVHIYAATNAQQQLVVVSSSNSVASARILEEERPTGA